jgi:short-subunit dehydrogenase
METLDDVHHLIETNLLGLATTIDAVLPGMRRRRSGTIALIGSLAALQPLADAPGYSASKAGVLAYGEALREYLLPEGVTVALVHPGHIATAQVEDHVGALPLLMQPDDAAALIKRRLDKGHTDIAFPWQLLWLIRLGRLTPWRLRARFGQGFRFHVRK